MENEIITFNKEGFGEIRTLTIDNEPWFVGKDMTRAGLFKWMRDNGYIYKRSTKAKQKYVKEGLFKLHTFASTGAIKYSLLLELPERVKSTS